VDTRPDRPDLGISYDHSPQLSVPVPPVRHQRALLHTSRYSLARADTYSVQLFATSTRDSQASLLSVGSQAVSYSSWSRSNSRSHVSHIVLQYSADTLTVRLQPLTPAVGSGCVGPYSFRPSCTEPVMRPWRRREATESRANEFVAYGLLPAARMTPGPFSGISAREVGL
jgi:hypothetical protein